MKKSLFRLRFFIETAREDPIGFGILVSRKIPNPWRNRITNVAARVFPFSVVRVIIYIIGDRRDDAERQYGRLRSGKLRDLLGLYIHGDLSKSQLTYVRARKAWDIGDMDNAIRLIRPSSLTARRWRAVKNVLGGDYRPENLCIRTTAKVSPDLLQSVRDQKKSSTGLRVLHLLTNSFPYTLSGYSVRSHAVLRSQRELGINCLAVTRLGYPENIGVQPKDNFEEVDGVPYCRLSGFEIPPFVDERLALNYQLILAIARVYEPDVIHVTTNYENGLIGRSVANALGVPWVYETRGEMEKTWLARCSDSDYERAVGSSFFVRTRKLETQLMCDASRVIALSNVQKQSHIERSVDSSKIDVIHNSVERETLAKPGLTSSDARKQLNLTDRFTIGTITSIVDYEGLEVLLLSLDKIRDMKPDMKIQAVIVGDGAALPSLMDLAEKRNLLDLVSFVGKVPPSEVLRWYDAIDVFCIPRKDVDVARAVTPLKPLQAMARCRPVVVSDLPALTEITTDRGAGIAVKAGDPHALADAIIRLFESPELYESLAERAFSFAEDTTWESAGSDYSKIYQLLVNQSR
ncbi:glycosyltransferase family 4 protein [Corynebacterium sp. TAE3-ERU16]|uniref:glycosyltransferase family 4 protein n=1 Tax=Corynebacterium sp. TAE3-ERU16 TaxID=2849493 RepID=UPI001C478091|nr:glycosyltransferase family 4 protein [Corynebacterium sp. TAE3-ERU16]MBV7294237.1 glycosyltransferase family 4 protein [Corynebacterium sp. TAE3-ERU16]